MRGRVDVVSPQYVSGWACGPSGEAVSVEVFVDGAMVGTAMCDGYRKDIEHILGGHAAFRFVFPRPLDWTSTHVVSVRPTGMETVLPGVTQVEAINLAQFEQRGFIPPVGVLAFSMQLDVAATAKDVDGHRHIAGTFLTDQQPPDTLRGIDGTIVKSYSIAPASDHGVLANLKLIPFRAVLDPADKPIASAEFTERKKLRYASKPWGAVARLSVPAASYDLSYVPPDENSQRTCGDLEPMGFTVRGLTDAIQHVALYLSAARRLPARGAWLDWGCGAGRIAVPLKRFYLPHWDIHGVDVDAVNIELAQTLCSDVNYHPVGFDPPLPFPDNTFDAAHGLSVMTHLTMTNQVLWLGELRRVMKRGGVVILTTHGEVALLNKPQLFQSRVIDDVLAQGISDATSDKSLGPLLTDKDYYRATFQSTHYTSKLFARYFKIVEHIPGGSRRDQDFWVLAKDQ